VSVHSRRVQQKRKEIQKNILFFNRDNLDSAMALAGVRFGSTVAVLPALVDWEGAMRGGGCKFCDEFKIAAFADNFAAGKFSRACYNLRPWLKHETA